ncbi:MAG: D-arabinono-1,4-lactone oxidase [Bacteroidota bacterium]
MKNWAGNVQWHPNEIAYPTTEEAIQALVLKAANMRKKIRVIGTGHSFTALCATNDILLSLDQYQGLVAVDHKKIQATVKGGTKLHYLGDLLFKEGMAMENLGDIDVQSIAGTISTGTHGTGQSLGTISTQVVALRLINGKGEVLDCSATQNPELFKAAQVSMGALGIITQVTLQCVPCYKLMIHAQAEKLNAVLGNLQERLDKNRNFEFFWLPYTQTTLTKSANMVEDSTVDKVSFFNYWTEYVMENLAFKMICEFGAWFPSKAQAISKFTAGMVTNVRKTQHSHKIYATPRLVKFREMEYNIPAAAYQDVWKEVVRTIDKHQFQVHFPIENRWVKGDDILMSPAYGRDSAYIACHVYYKKPHRAYFDALEAIFQAHDGRPHWGKMNQLEAVDVAKMYPQFSTFIRHQKEQDPDGIFITPYMSRLLGVGTARKTLATP